MQGRCRASSWGSPSGLRFPRSGYQPLLCPRIPTNEVYWTGLKRTLRIRESRKMCRIISQSNEPSHRRARTFLMHDRLREEDIRNSKYSLQSETEVRYRSRCYITSGKSKSHRRRHAHGPPSAPTRTIAIVALSWKPMEVTTEAIWPCQQQMRTLSDQRSSRPIRDSHDCKCSQTEMNCSKLMSHNIVLGGTSGRTPVVASPRLNEAYFEHLGRASFGCL